MRPTLRPGLRPLRRDRHTWQLGLDWPGSAVLADDPATTAVLEALDGFRDVEAVLRAVAAKGTPREAAESVLRALVECGAVVDANRARPADIPPATWASWSLLSGPAGTAHDIAAARAATSVCVLGEGLLADEVRRLLPRARLPLTERWMDADLVVAISDHEPDRSQSDALMHRSAPHLWAYTRDVVGVVGPLVTPGSDACLRCVDASRADIDRCWPTLIAAANAHPVEPPATDPVIAALVAALAVHEAAVWCSGLPAQTAGAVLEVPYGYGPVTGRGFEQHPACGCGWPTWHDTMGA